MNVLLMASAAIIGVVGVQVVAPTRCRCWMYVKIFRQQVQREENREDGEKRLVIYGDSGSR